MASDYPPTPTGLVLSGDVAALQAENAVLRRQVAELTDHNDELLRDKQALRAWCRNEQQTAEATIAVTGRATDAPTLMAYWLGRGDLLTTLWQRIKPPDSNESPDSASGSQESRSAEADH